MKFSEKLVELSVVHFIDIEDEEHCSELKFISAPLKQSYYQSEDEGKGMIRFKCLDGGVFWPGRRMGKISLQHFCLIGIARRKREEGEERVMSDTTESSSIIRLKSSLSPSQFMIMLSAVWLITTCSVCVYVCVCACTQLLSVFIKRLSYRNC